MVSTPMFDIPDHFPIPVDVLGRGPAAPEDTVAEVCWCGASGCELWREGEVSRG